MSQADYTIADQDGASFLVDINNQLAAIVSNNSGATEPATKYAYQWWADTSSGLLKIRNAANSAWVTIGTLGSANLGLLALSGGTLTGALNEAQGADIASAGTVNLTTATGNYVHITGTTTITAITLAQGATRTVVFDGALTLTNGASLLLPTAANITTAAGDTAVFRGEASSVVRCVDYTRKSGSPLVAGSDASSTVKGIVELATSAEIKTGTDSTRAIVSDQLLEAQGFTASFLSAAQTITSAGALTIGHGLGRKPVLIHAYIKNTTTEANYSVGDEIFIAPFFDNGSTLFGCSIVPDATNLNIRFSNAGNFMIVPNKTTGARTVLTNANWKLYIRAWA